MALELAGYVELPAHRRAGGFDHADIHYPTQRLYVAHTSNDALDIIDIGRDRFVESVSGLTGVAGALVSHERKLVFTSNRGEDTVSVFSPGSEGDAVKIAVGMKPNGLAFSAARGILIAANVGDSSVSGSHTVSVVDIVRRERVAEIPVPGRTRWAAYDAARDMFFVNIASPACIIGIDVANSTRIARTFEVSAAGPHGLDFDAASGRLLCACDDGTLVAIDADSDRECGKVTLSGAPDVIFLHPELKRLYVAVGDPGAIDVVDTEHMRLLETVITEPGAHTLALDRQRRKVYAFLPQTHRAAVYREV